MYIRRTNKVLESSKVKDPDVMECEPIVPPTRSKNGSDTNSLPVAEIITNLDELPQYVMNESTMLFRMDARTAWTRWAFSLMNYAVSLNGDLPGTDQVKGRMHKNAVILGDFLVPYYGMTAGRAVTTALIAIDDIGMHYVEAKKAKKPTEEIVASWAPYVADIASLLNELNPTNWPTMLLQDQFSNLVRAWQEQLDARAAGNILGDEIAIDYLNKLVVTGVKDHNFGGYSSIADIFSRGIIAQFPSMFAE